MSNILTYCYLVKYPGGHQFIIYNHHYFTTKFSLCHYYVIYSMFNLSVIYCCNIPPSGGESEFVYCYPHPFSLCFQDCYLDGTQVKMGTTHQGNSTTRPRWSGKGEVREPTIGSGAEVRVPPHLSFTRLLLLSPESESEAEPNQDDFASRTGTVPTNFCEATTNAQATAYKSATTSPSNPRNHLPTPVRSRIRNSLLGDYPSSKITSLMTGLEYSFPSTHLFDHCLWNPPFHKINAGTLRKKLGYCRTRNKRP